MVNKSIPFLELSDEDKKHHLIAYVSSLFKDRKETRWDDAKSESRYELFYFEIIK